jgi:hypothetical protein
MNRAKWMLLISGTAALGLKLSKGSEMDIKYKNDGKGKCKSVEATLYIECLGASIDAAGWGKDEEEARADLINNLTPVLTSLAQDKRVVLWVI